MRHLLTVSSKPILFILFKYATFLSSKLNYLSSKYGTELQPNWSVWCCTWKLFVCWPSRQRIEDGNLIMSPQFNYTYSTVHCHRPMLMWTGLVWMMVISKTNWTTHWGLCNTYPKKNTNIYRVSQLFFVFSLTSSSESLTFIIVCCLEISPEFYKVDYLKIKA